MATSVRQASQRRVPIWGIVVVAVLTASALAAGVFAILDDPAAAPRATNPPAAAPQAQGPVGAVTNLDALPSSPVFVPRELGSSIGPMRVTGWVSGAASIDPGSASSSAPVTIGSFVPDIAGSDRVDVATQLIGTGCTSGATAAVTRLQLVDGSSVVASAQVSLPQGSKVGALATTSLAVPSAQATRPLSVRVLLDNCATGASGDGFAVRVAATRLAS
ncbi:MAG: hypothetical protein JWM86_715 [Thermoleophilia bacterium]|nr:hypothetical protein [Thermoleophilia bacterium]